MDDEKAELEENQKDLQSSMNTLQNKKDDLSDKKLEAASMLTKLNKDSQAYKDQIAQIEKDMDETERLLTE